MPVTIQMKAIEQYSYVVLFIMLYKVDITVLFFKSMDETVEFWNYTDHCKKAGYKDKKVIIHENQSSSVALTMPINIQWGSPSSFLSY